MGLTKLSFKIKINFSKALKFSLFNAKMIKKFSIWVRSTGTVSKVVNCQIFRNYETPSLAGICSNEEMYLKKGKGLVGHLMGNVCFWHVKNASSVLKKLKERTFLK